MSTITATPGTVVNDSTVGSTDWTASSGTLVSAVAADDGVYDQVSLSPSSSSHYLKMTNYDFSALPDAAALNSVKYRAQRNSNSGGGAAFEDFHVHVVKAGTIQSTEFAISGAWPGSDTDHDYDITSGLTVADLKNSGFGMVHSGQETLGGAVTGKLDYTPIIVDYTYNVFTATSAVTVGAATCSASATFSPGTHTATVAVTIGHATCSASATFSPGTHTATAALTVGAATCSATATFSAGTHTSTVAVTVGAATCAAVATFSPGTHTATAAVTIGHATCAANALFNSSGVFLVTSTSGCVTGAATCAATATTGNPSYSGVSHLTTGHITCHATALFSTASVNVVFHCGLIAPAAICNGQATYTLPPGSGTFIAGLAKVDVLLKVYKGNMRYGSRPTSFVAPVGASGPLPGAVSVAVTGTDVSFTALGTPGLCNISNISKTGVVEYGTWDSGLGRFYPLGEMLPGEVYTFRISRNVATLRLKASPTTCIVKVEAFSK